MSHRVQSPVLLAATSFQNARLARPALAPLVGLLPAHARMPLEVMTVQPRTPRLRLRFRPRAIVGFRPKARVGTAGQNELEPEPPEPLETTPAWEELDILSGLSTSIPENGRPATQILQRAQTIQAGMIAIATQSVHTPNPASNEPRSQEWLLRGMAAIVARQATCPVLMIPPLENPSPTWKRVALLVTDTEATQGAIALTRQLIPTGIKHITVLSIQPPLNLRYLFSPFTAPTPDWQFHQFLEQVQRERSEEQVKKVAIALKSSGISVETAVQTGDIAMLVKTAAQQADLIVMGNPSMRRLGGSNARSLLRSIRLWAMSEAVLLHASCPVFISQSHHRTSALKSDRK